VKLHLFILTLLVFFLSLGSSVLFFWQLHKIRYQAEQEIKSGIQENLLTFSFSSQTFKQLKWIKKNKEFRIDGKMYDVAYIKRTGKMFIVFCYYDINETYFWQIFKTFVSGNNDKSLPIRYLMKITGWKYISDFCQVFSKPDIFKTVIFKHYFFRESTVFIAPEFPPPKMFLFI